MRCGASTCAGLYRRMLTRNIGDSHRHHPWEANAGSLPKLRVLASRARTRLSRLLGYPAARTEPVWPSTASSLLASGKRLAALPQLRHLGEKIDLAAGQQGEERIYGCRGRRTRRLKTNFINSVSGANGLGAFSRPGPGSASTTGCSNARLPAEGGLALVTQAGINLLRQSLLHDVPTYGSLNRLFAPQLYHWLIDKGLAHDLRGQIDTVSAIHAATLASAVATLGGPV